MGAASGRDREDDCLEVCLLYSWLEITNRSFLCVCVCVHVCVCDVYDDLSTNGIFVLWGGRISLRKVHDCQERRLPETLEVKD